MEQKTKKQYTFLIYPYVVDEKGYDEYLLNLLNNKNIKLKLWNKENDLNLYTYFTPEIKEKIFWTFSYNNTKIKQLNELDNVFKSKVLSQYEMVMFEYCANSNIQAKIGEDNILLFDIDKIDIICFKTGICFILLKTSLGNEIELSDVLEFNNKFRTIYYDFVTLKNEKINVQTDDLKDITELYSIIKNIIGKNKDAKDLKIIEERIVPYSYVCLSEDAWSGEFDNKLKENFVKLYKVLPDKVENLNMNEYRSEVLELSDFLKVGITKQGTGIISSNSKIENSLKIPYLFEQEYLYTYLITLYKKLYVNKLLSDFEKTKKFEKIKEKLERFTEDIWIKSITQNEDGKMLKQKWEEKLHIQYKYEKLKINMTLNK